MSAHFALALFLAAFGLISTTAAQAADDPMLKITGELTYRERIALPPDSLAIVEIRAADAAEADTVLVETRIEMGSRQVPVPFSLEVERERFAEGKTYLLRGGILSGLTIAWLTDPVEIDPNTDSVDLGTLLVKAHRTPPPFGLAEIHDIVGVEWVVEDIDGGGIIDSSRVTVIFDEDGNVGGRGSCNSYGGTWSEKDGSLSISQIISTQMACAEALMNQERNFFDILATLGGFTMSPDGALILRTADGRTLKARREDG